jgi:hypothetical protein
MLSRQANEVLGVVRRKLVEAEHVQEELYDVRSENAALKEANKELERCLEEHDLENDELRLDLYNALDELESLRNHYECLDYFDQIVQEHESRREVAELEQELDAERYERWQVEQENKVYRETRRDIEAELAEYRRLYGPLP